jgi:hypothetical protein
MHGRTRVTGRDRHGRGPVGGVRGSLPRPPTRRPVRVPTPHPYYRLLDLETGAVAESYFDTGRHVRDAGPDLPDLVTHRNAVSDFHDALCDAGFDVEAMLEPGSPDPEDYEPGPWGEQRPELRCKVPSVLPFGARQPA